MDIDNEDFFRKADVFTNVGIIFHRCTYCGTDQSQKECVNCGAPHEPKKNTPKKRPVAPPSRSEVDDGIVFGIWFCTVVFGLLLLSLLII